MRHKKAALLLAFMVICGTFALLNPATGSALAGTAPSSPVAAGSSGIAATAPVASADAQDSATAPMTAKEAPDPGTASFDPGTDTLVLWQDSVQACIEKGGPIGIDEYFMAMIDLFKQGDLILVNDLRDLMTCGQLADTSQILCSADKVMVKPFFIESSLDATGRSLTFRENQKAEELIGEAGKACLDGAVHDLMYMGKTSFLGKDLAAGICSLFGDKAGDGCETKFKSYLAALDKGDPAMCDSVSKYEDQEYCLLFTSKNPDVCKRASFKSVPLELCQDQLTAFKILRKIPLGKDEKLNKPEEGYLAVAVNLMKDKNYCDTLYRKKLLPAYCHGKDINSLEKIREEQEKNVIIQKKNQEEAEKIEKEKKAREAEEAKERKKSSEK